MLFYFTATGNCLYVAKSLDFRPISIPQAIHGKMEFTDEKIGIVAPIYGHELPNMVKEFIRNAKFHTDYFYLVLTYGCRHGGASELALEFCRSCGIEPAYINVLLMVDNWLPNFDMDEQRKMEKHIDENLAVIKADIESGKRMISTVTDEDRGVHKFFLDLMSKQPADLWQHMIVVKDNCNGCGTCAKVCPSGSIRVKDRKAVFTSGKCETCFACIHACPQKAIGLSVPEENPEARFRNEHVRLGEIIDANNQAKWGI